MKDIQPKLIQLAFIYLLCTLPFSPKWGNFGLVFLTCLGFYHFILTKTANKVPGFFFFIILAFLVRLIWIWRANDLIYAFKCIETESPMLLFPIIFISLPMSITIRNISSIVFVLISGATIFYAFIQYGIYGSSSPYPFIEFTKLHFNPSWFWNHSRYFSHFYLNWPFAHYSFISTMLIYALIVLWFLPFKFRGYSIVKWAFIFLVFFFIVLVGSRAGIVLLTIFSLIYLLWSIRNSFVVSLSWSKLTVIIIVSITTCIIIYSNFKWDSSRNYFADIALDAWMKNPVLGYGTGGNRDVMNDESIKRIFGYTVNHPHNQYLTELLQFGIIGSLPFYIFIIYSFYFSIKKKNEQLFLVILIASVFMTVESPLNSNKGLVPLLFVVCLVGFPWMEDKANSHVEKKRCNKRLFMQTIFEC